MKERGAIAPPPPFGRIEGAIAAALLLALEFLTGGVELLWGKCTVFPVPVQGILTGGT